MGMSNGIQKTFVKSQRNTWKLRKHYQCSIIDPLSTKQAVKVEDVHYVAKEK